MLCLTSCSHDFLDREPPGSYTSANFWETPQQIEDAITPAYRDIRGLYSSALWQLGEYRSDNTTFTENLDDRGNASFWNDDIFVSGPNVNGADGVWNTCYSGIKDMNLVLANLDDVPYTGQEEERELRRAEAHFFRGFFYHLLTLHFGDVPLTLEPVLTEEEALQLDRVPLDEVYAQAILPDLELAIAGLPDEWPDSELGRATSYAARMLLAKAHFARRDYAAALPLLDEIVASGRYRLLSDFRSVFAPDMGYNDEIIFAGIYDVGAGQGGLFYLNWLPLNSGTEVTEGSITSDSRWGVNRPTRGLYEAYSDDDPRREATIGVYAPAGDTVLYARKYLFPPINSGTDVDVVIFRYADVLLMRAEAILETSGGGVAPNQAFLDVNAVRDRAGLVLAFPGNVQDTTLDVRTSPELLELVRRERRLELALENTRWYDLVRYGTVQEVMMAHGGELAEYQPYLQDFPSAFQTIPELFPIPLTQVQQYGYAQNPGY